ncbi:hypothetical protein FPQ18DRAFT_372851 [Pyronema domesticum]|nr:hypothetical protein FPQ18DRAFT_372851 [Pyronema domesticum]
MLRPLLLVQALVGLASAAEQLVPFKYQTLPLGSIKPLGWLRNQLELSASGLAGHEWDFYRFVNNSTWTGGTWEYSGLHETAPYWFNYIVPLAYTLDDARLKKQAKEFLDHVLATQQADGWLGTETKSEERGLWGRFFVLMGMIQYAEAEPSETERIVTAMHKFVNLAHSMLKQNYLGLVPRDANDVFGAGNHGVTRAHEMATAFQWLYDNHPNGNEENIWGAIDLMFKGGIAAQRDWRTFFVDGVFPTVGMPDIVDRRFVHGVDLAEGMRWPTALYRLDKNQSLIEQTHKGVNLTFTYHGANSGTITADEQLAGMAPNRGSELCMSVETMWTMSYLYNFYGTNAYADRAEKVAFNAMPAMLTPDWWGHQYAAMANQPFVRNMTKSIFANIGKYGTVFGLEPNYPCCTVNHPQGYPKFLANSFVKYGNNGLIHALLSPGEVKTILANNNQVTVTSTTDYPFRTTITYSINAVKAFDFYIRIPEWTVLGSSGISINSNSVSRLKPTAEGHQKVSVRAGKTEITISFGQQLEVVTRMNDAVAIHRGPLLYALDLEYTDTSIPSQQYNPLQPLPDNQLYLPYTKDHSLTPTTPWAIAIDPKSIKVHEEGGALREPIYKKGGPPLWLELDACDIDWAVTDDILDLPPKNPVCKSGKKKVRFAPYGSTKVRMTELPIMKV